MAENQDDRPGQRNGPAPGLPTPSGRRQARHGDYRQTKHLGLTLDKKEARFVTAMVRAIDAKDGKVDPVEAARLAGFSDPDVSAYDVLGRPHVQTALAARATRHIFGRLLPAALVAHEEILTDRGASPAARMQAIRAVYEISGIDAKQLDPNTSKSGKTVAEMSNDELQDLIDRSKAAVETIEARAIDVTPDSQSDSHPTDGADVLSPSQGD